MREKLISYVRELFRSASDCQENRDLEAEILQNSLDRFDDLVSRGVAEEQAYQQTVDSIGDVKQLLRQTNISSVIPKKKHTGRIVLAACAVLLLAAVLPGLGRYLFGHFQPSRDDDHWGNRMEDDLEHWVDQMDEEYGFSVLLPNSTYEYSEAEQFYAGGTELPAKTLEEGQLSLCISWFAGTVTVQTWNRDEISVQETGARDENTQLHWRLENGTLDIEYCASGQHETLPSKDLTVKLPTYVAENMRRVSVDGISQDVLVEGLTVDQLRLCSASGNQEFSGTAEKVVLETTSGETTLILTKTPDLLEYESVSGDLIMTMPKGRCFEVEFETVSGSFDCDFPKERSDDDWLVNPEENRVIRGEFELETISGNVRIKKG